MNKKSTVYFVVIFVILSQACDVRDSPLDDKHTISVRNLSECTLAICLDDLDIMYLTAGSEKFFQDVSEGYHDLAAYLYENQNIGEEIDRVTIFVSREKDYRWDIRNCD